MLGPMRRASVLLALWALGCGSSASSPHDGGQDAPVTVHRDAGKSPHDAAGRPRDSGSHIDSPAHHDSGVDAPRPPHDTGTVTVDTGTHPTDAGAPTHNLANGGFGMFNPNGEANWATDITTAEGLTGRHMDLVLDYADWPSGTSAWPTMPADVIAGIGGRPMMWTVQPSGVSWPDLIAGTYDSEIIAFADWVNTTLKSLIYVRFAHEANGTGWYNWQVGGSDGVTSAADYVSGYNHVASLLKASSTYILMVWAANNGPTDNIGDFYPSGCDIMGFDTYNFGPNTSSTGQSVGGASGPWTEAPALNATAYAAVAAADPNKPIWICETSSEDPSAPWNPTTYDPSQYPNNIIIAAQPGHSKGEWVTTFLSETDMPRITAVVWFDVLKERDWVFNSSDASTNAFYGAFSQSRDGGVYWNQATGGP
jgi:hypothetical protein